MSGVNHLHSYNLTQKEDGTKAWQCRHCGRDEPYICTAREPQVGVYDLGERWVTTEMKDETQEIRDHDWLLSLAQDIDSKELTSAKAKEIAERLRQIARRLNRAYLP